MSTFYQMWGVTKPEEAKAKIEEQKAKAFEFIKNQGRNIPINLEEQALMLVGRDIYEALIKGIQKSNGEDRVGNCQRL